MIIFWIFLLLAAVGQLAAGQMVFVPDRVSRTADYFDVVAATESAVDMTICWHLSRFFCQNVSICAGCRTNVHINQLAPPSKTGALEFMGSMHNYFVWSAVSSSTRTFAAGFICVVSAAALYAPRVASPGSRVMVTVFDTLMDTDPSQVEQVSLAVICGGSQLLVQCLEKRSDSCGVFLCDMMSSVCGGHRVRVLYTSSTSATIEAVVDVTPSATLSLEPALIPEYFDTVPVKVSVSFWGRSCPSEGVNVTITNPGSFSVLFLPQSTESKQTCFQVFQVCSPTYSANTCDFTLRGSSLQFFFEGLSARLYSASPFPLQVSPVLMSDSPLVVPFTIRMFVPGLPHAPFIRCDLFDDDANIGTIPLYESDGEINVFRGNGSICTNRDCADAFPASSLISASKFDVRCSSGLLFANGSSFMSQLRVSVIRPCPVLLSANATSPASSSASVLVGGSIFLSVVDPLFCRINTSLNCLILSSNLRTQLNITIPFVTGSQCGKLLSFGPGSHLYTSSSSDVTFLYCSGGTRICSTASLRLLGLASLSLSHSVLLPRTVQDVVFTLTDYHSSNSVSISALNGNRTTEELVLYETSEGSGVFESSTLVCCSLDGCPGLSMTAGFAVAFYYQSKVFAAKLNCSDISSLANAANCSNSSAPSLIVPGHELLLRVYDLFLGAPFSVSLQVPLVARSLRFIGAAVDCNNSVVIVPLYRSSTFSFDGKFVSISSLCPNATLGARIKFTALVASEYVAATAVVEAAPLTSIFVDSAQSVFQGAQVHVTVRRTPGQCQRCNEQFMLTIRSSLSVIVVPSPSAHQDGEFFMFFVICGPGGPQDSPALECINAAVGDTLYLEAPGANSFRLRVESSPALVASVSHVVTESCFYVHLSNFSQSMSFQLGSLALIPQHNSHGMFFIRGCLSNDRILYINGQFGLNATLLSSLTFGLHLGGFQVSSIKIFILPSALNVEILNSTLMPFLARGSSLTVVVAVRNLHLPSANLTVFASSGQTVSIPFLVSSSSLTLIPVVLNPGCLRNSTEICAFDGISVVASVCMSSCFSSRSIQIFFAPDINVPIQHPAGSTMTIDVLDSSITSDHVFVNISLGSSQSVHSTHRLIKSNASSGHFGGKIPILEVERSVYQSSQQFIVVKAPYNLRINYFNYSKYVSIVKQSAASLSCYEDSVGAPPYQRFRIMLSHSGALASEYVEIKLSSVTMSNTQSQDIRLFRTPNSDVYIGFLDISSSTIAIFGSMLKASYAYEFEFQSQIASCVISVTNSGSLTVSPPAIIMSHAFEIVAFHYAETNASIALIESCFIGSVLPCMNLQLESKSPGYFFAVFNSSQTFPFVVFGSNNFSPLTVCFTFGPFQSCILIADYLEVEHPYLISPADRVVFASRAFVPVSDNMPKQLACSFYPSSQTSKSLFNTSLVWNASSQSFTSNFVVHNECGAACDSLRVVNVVCRYGSVSSSFSLSFHAPLFVRIEVPQHFVPKSSVPVTVFDADANRDSSLIETAVAFLDSDDALVPASFELVETGPSTGAFRSNVSVGSSTRLIASYRSLNGQSVRAISLSSPRIRADLSVLHCDSDFQCNSPQPFQLPLITQFSVCSLSFLNLALRVSCSSSSQLLIPIPIDKSGSCWLAHVLAFPWYSTDVPHLLGSNQFICFTSESSLVVSSVVESTYPLIPISPVIEYVIPQAPVLFASPIFLSSSSNVSIFLFHVRGSAPQVLNVISSDGYMSNITMKKSNAGDFIAIFNPKLALSSLTNAVLRFVWRDTHQNADLECQVAACSPAVLISPSSIGFQGIAIISIFKNQAALKLVLQVNNTATQQTVLLSVTEKHSNESGTLYDATLRISSSKSAFGSDGQPLLYALVGSVLIVSFQESCPFSLLQSSLLVTASSVGTLQAPSTILAGSDIQIFIDDSDLQSSNSLNPMLVNIRALSSIDFKRYQFPVQPTQKFVFKIPTTTNASLIHQSSLLVNTTDTITLVYEDAAPYQQSSVVLSVSPSCAANFSVGPLPIEFNRNISIRVMDCDVTSRNVSVRIATVKGFCNVVLGASLNAPGVFAASIVLKNDNAKGDCASLRAIVGDTVAFYYDDDAPQSNIQQTHILHNESVADIFVDRRFVMLDQVVQVSLAMCVNSDKIEPVLVRNVRSPPSPKFSPAVVAGDSEIELTRVSECVFVGSIQPLLLPMVPGFFDHDWMNLYSSPCQNCIYANEGDELKVWWPGSDHIETSFAIAQRAFFQAPSFAAAGSKFEIQVFDRDADFSASAFDSISVNVTFLETTVSFVLLEDAQSSGVFLGVVYLSNFSALGSMTTPFLSTASTCVILQYKDNAPSAIIETRVNVTSNYFATLEISPQTSYPGSSVVIQVLDATRNQSPFVRDNVNVTVQGNYFVPRTLQLFETSENSGVFAAQFILSNGSVIYNVSNPFGVPAFAGQKYSIKYINSAPHAVLSKNIVIAGPGQIFVNSIDLAQVVKVTLIDPDNSDFYTDTSSVRKIQNLVATSASGNFLAFTVQEQNPGTGTFYGTFNVSTSSIFKPGVLIGVSLASRVLISYLDALPPITITTSVKVASIGSILIISSSSDSAMSDSEFVFKIVDFDMNLDPHRLEEINVTISTAPNSNYTVPCFESNVDSSEFVCRTFLTTKMSAPTSLDPSVFVLQASRGQVFTISYLDSIPAPATFRTAKFTVAVAGALTSNASFIFVGTSFVINLENFNSNTNPSAKDSAFLTVEHWFAGYLQSSMDFALPETAASSSVFMGSVATSSLAAPSSSASASVVVPSVKPGSVLMVFFRQPAFNLFLNVTVVVSSTPVFIIPAILLNADSDVVVSISDIDLNATNILISSLNVTVSQPSVSPKSAINVTLFASSSNSAFFTGSFRLCSIQNCSSDLFAPEGSSVYFSYDDLYTGLKIVMSRSVSTKGRMVVPATVLSQNSLTIRVFDIDMDVSNALDTVTVVACVVGYTETVSIVLTETDSKSGIFQGVLVVKDIGTASVAGAIIVPPRGTIQFIYEDHAPSVVVLSSVVVSVPNQIILQSPIVIGSYFFINVSDSSATDPYSIVELSFWGGGTRIILSLISPGFYSGRAMIADKCSNSSLFSGCIAIMYGTDVQAVYRGSSQLSITIPKSAMTMMIPLIRVCAAGRCISSWEQAPDLFLSNGGTATILVTDYDFAALNSLPQFVSVSCGNVSDSLYLDVFRGSLPATQFSASLTVFTDFGEHLASPASAKLACPAGSLVLFQIRDCNLPDFIVLSARVVDLPRFYTIPTFVIGDYLFMQLQDIVASTLEASVTCTSIRDSETIAVSREAVGGTFMGSIYISATFSQWNDGRLSVVMVGERIDCKYVSDATSIVAVASSVANSCSQLFRLGYSPSNSSSILVLEALLCDPMKEIFASIQCSSGDREDVLLVMDSENPGRHFGTVGFASNLASVAQHNMIVSLDSSALIPCVSTIRLSGSNATLSGSLYRRVEPVLSAVFDSSISIRACIWDADAVSFGQMGRFVSFSLRHESGNCTSQLSASETAPFSGLFCRSNINLFDVLNASQCKSSTMSHYTMVYKAAHLCIPIRNAISFDGTSSTAVIGSRIPLVASVSTVNQSAFSIDSLGITVRYSSGIQERILLYETGISTSFFSGFLYIPPACSRLVWNRTVNDGCHYLQATYVEVFLDHLQSPFLITLFSPPVFHIAPVYPVINGDVIVSVVVTNVSSQFVDAVATSALQPFSFRLYCSLGSSLCTGTIAGASFRSSPLVISVLFAYGVYSASVVGNVAPTIKSMVSSSGIHAITVKDCNSVANFSILTATCKAAVQSISLAKNGCLLTTSFNISRNFLTSQCSSVVLEYKNLVVFNQAILAIYNPTLGLLNVTASVAAGSSISVAVNDLDANLNPMKIDVIIVTVCSSRTSEPCEDIVLTESQNSSGFFFGTIVTVQDASVSLQGDGVLNVLPNHVVTVSYSDNSISSIVTKTVRIVAPCSWSVDSIPQKIVAGDLLSISVRDVDLNPLVRDNSPNPVGIRNSGVWSNCNLLEDAIGSGIYVGQCQTDAWTVGSMASIYYNCSQSNLQLDASIFVVSAPRVIVDPNPIFVGDSVSITVFDAVSSSSSVAVSLVHGSTSSAISLRLPRVNSSEFSATFPTALANDVVACSFPLTFPLSTQYINVSYSVVSRPSSFSVVQLKLQTYLKAKAIFPNLFLKVINPETFPFNVSFDAPSVNISCSVSFSSSGWISLGLIYSDLVQNLTCNTTAIVIPISAQLDVRRLNVQYFNAVNGGLLQQKVSIPAIPSFDVSNISSVSSSLQVRVSGLSVDVGSNVSLRAQSFSSTGSIVNTEFTLLQNSSSGSFNGMFKLSSLASKGFLLLVPQGYVQFLVNGFLSSKYYLYRSCSVSIFADFVDSSRRELFVDVRTCSNDSIVASASVVPSETAISLNMVQIPSSGLQVLRRASLPVSFSTQTSGALYLTSSSIVRVTVATSVGDTISKLFSLPAWGNLSCFSISKSSRLINAVALGRRLFASSIPNSDFSDPIFVQFSFGSDFEEISAVKQPNGNWVASLLVEYSAYLVAGDGKFSNVTVGSTIFASIGNASCSAIVYMQPSLTVSSNYNGSSWILEVQYVASSQITSLTVFAQVDLASGAAFLIPLENTAHRRFSGLVNLGLLSCNNVSVWLLDVYEGNLSSTHQIPCQPRLSLWPSLNSSASYVIQGELLDIEVDSLGTNSDAVTVMVQYDAHEPAAHQLLALAGSSRYHITVAATADETVSVFLSVTGFSLSSSIRVVAKSTIQLYPPVIRSDTSELFIFVTDSLQSSQLNTTVGLAISGCSISSDIALNCIKQNGIFVGNVAILPSNFCIGFRLVASYTQRGASSNVSVVVFASPLTEILKVTISPSSAVAGDFIDIVVNTSSSALQPAGLVISIHGDSCDVDTSSLLVTLLPVLSGSNMFRSSVQIGATAAVLGSCQLAKPGKYVITAYGNSSVATNAYVDVVFAVPVITLNATRVDAAHSVQITVVDVAAMQRSSVSVAVKVFRHSIALLLQKSGEAFYGNLQYALVADVLDAGIPSVVGTIEYMNAAGSAAVSKVIFGAPLVPGTLKLGDIVAFTLNSTSLCFVQPSQIQVTAATSSFPDRLLNVSVVDVFLGRSCLLSCRFKTSLYTRARPGYQEPLDILTALPNDDLIINVVFPWHGTTIVLRSQATLAPSFDFSVPSYISTCSDGLEITFSDFGSRRVSVVVRNTAFQNAIATSFSKSTSHLFIPTSNVAFLQSELYVRPGDFIVIQARIEDLGLFFEAQTAVAEIASIKVDPETPEFGSLIQVDVFDSDAPDTSEAVVCIVRGGKRLPASNRRFILQKRTPRVLSAQFDLSQLIFARMTDALMILYKDSAPLLTVVSYNISFRKVLVPPIITAAGLSGANFTSSLSVKSSGELRLNIQSKYVDFNSVPTLSCTVCMSQSGFSSNLDVENTMLYRNAFGVLEGSIQLMSVEISAFARKCANAKDGCLVVESQRDVNITCGNTVALKLPLGQLPLHAFFSDVANSVAIFTGYPDTSVAVTALNASADNTLLSCQSNCTRTSGSFVLYCSLCDSPLLRSFQAVVNPSPSVNLTLLTFTSESLTPLQSVALADSSLFCATASASFANIALSPSSSSCGDCYGRLAFWNSSSDMFELTLPFSVLRPFINASSCLHVWLVLPTQVRLSSAVCFTPPEFTTSTPLQNSVLALGLDCRREVVVSVTSSSVCYRMLSRTAGLHMIQIDSVAARISWRYSPALELPARVCVQAVIAPLGCDGPMGTGPQVLFANRCWSIVIEPCVACASIGDNLATLARRYSVDPVAIASIFFAARANTFAGETNRIDTDLPFGAPVRLGLVYEGSAGESLQVFQRLSLSNSAAISTLNPNMDAKSSIEGKLVCLPVDVQPRNALE